MEILNITERDIDLVLLEEFSVNPDFLNWFCSHFDIECMGLDNIWHSLTDTFHGESDLTVVVKSGESKTAILIENKIDAITMPRQAERYRLRGEQGIRLDQWDNFKTCMVATQHYFQTLKASEIYDHQITYEALSQEIGDGAHEGMEKNRATYKQDLFALAISKQKQRSAKPKDPLIEKFLSDYLYYLSTSNVALPAPLIDGNWITFYLNDFEPSNTKVKLHHKFTQGLIELEFQCEAIQRDDLIGIFKPLAENGRTIKKHGKFLGICENIEPLDVYLEDKEQHAFIKRATNALSKLARDYKVIANNF